MIKTFNQFTKSLNEEQTEIIDISDESVYPRKGESIKSNNFFIIHHTAGLGDAHDVVHTLNVAKNKKGENVKLGVQWVVDRDGIIYKTLPTNSRGAHVGVSTGDRGAPAGAMARRGHRSGGAGNETGDCRPPQCGQKYFCQRACSRESRHHQLGGWHDARQR